jgi:ankyrin repeat protein
MSKRSRGRHSKGVGRRVFAFCLLPFALSLPAAAQTPTASEKAEALAAAARKGDAATVTKLLDDGVDVNSKFRYGTTALSFAADHGHLEVVKVLLARGAEVNVKDTFYNATPLTWAVSPALTRKPEHAEIVGLLLKHGATGKENALMTSVASGETATVKIILAQGGLSAETLTDALDAAARGKRTDIVTLLEAAGARPRPEVKLDEAQLARYVGTYRNPAGSELVIAIAAGQLTLGAGKSGTGGPPQPIALVARSETAFVGAEMPALKLSFTIEDGKVTAMVIAPASPANTFAKQ